jgi:type I restriction enzyme M protein
MERNVDLQVWEHFKQFESEIIIEPKKSSEIRIDSILNGASKKETGKKGFPEYIIRFKDNPNLILVIEDKDDQFKHESKDLNKPVNYAVDGAIHYGKALSKEFDVISIGVSGLSQNMRVTHYFHIKGNEKFNRLEFDKLLTPQEYLTFYNTDERKNKQDFENLLIFSDKLNKELFQLYKISENERAILIAAVLVALRSEKFKSSYKLSTDPLELCESITSSVKTELIKSKLKQDYVNLVIGHFLFICQSPKFQSDVQFLKELIIKIDKNLNGYIKNSQYQDVLGNLYIKFLEKANGDRQLGIVLTPEHITKFMCRLLELNDESVVFDNCAGTGGFLLTSSKQNSKLVGYEYEPKMFTLMVLNMMIHNLSLENIFHGDSLNEDNLTKIKELQPTAGILNPPYDGREWDFIEKNMSQLTKGSKCVAIVPMSLVTSMDNKNLTYRKLIMGKHTLESVFSMPNELFFNSNTNVVTCVILLTAHVPHPTQKNVFFGFYKEDGFEKRKKFGRYDINSTWKKVEDDWFWNYKNKVNIPEYCLTTQVTYNNEWCAEFFLEPDYESLKFENFELSLKEYVLTNQLR